jgi:hypothetical protein
LPIKSEGIFVNDILAVPNPNNIPIAQEYTEELRMKLTDGNIVDGAIK